MKPYDVNETLRNICGILGKAVGCECLHFTEESFRVVLFRLKHIKRPTKIFSDYNESIGHFMLTT